MFLNGGMPGLIVLLALAASEPLPVLQTPLTFEQAASPAVLAVETDPAADALAVIDGLAVIDPLPVAVLPAQAATPAAAQPQWVALGPDESKAIASWVAGDNWLRLPDIQATRLIPHIQLRAGPLVQLTALIPLCLVLLSRQRRFHERVVMLALPPHVAASRSLIGQS